MRLLYSPTSPYARKTRIAVIEKGLQNRVEEVVTVPAEDRESLEKHNPLGKIPTLVLDDGSALYDSPVIVDYLDHLDGNPRFTPTQGAARWDALRRQALGDGILDAAFNTTMERRRPENQRSNEQIERWILAIKNGVAAIESEIDRLGPELDIAHITFASVFGYLDLRYADLEWRNAAPKSAAWFAEFSKRPSMEQTKPE